MGNILERPVSSVVSRSMCVTGFVVLAAIIVVIGIIDEAGRGSSKVATPVTPVAVQLTLDDHEDGFDPLPQAVQAAAARSGHAGDTRAQQHRKQVFDQRRTRFEGWSDRQSQVSESGQPGNLLSTVFR